LVEQRGIDAAGLIQRPLPQQSPGGTLDEGHEGGVGLHYADAGQRLYLAGDQQRRMAEIEQRLAVVDHGEGQLLGAGRLACLLLQPEKERKNALGRTGCGGVHGVSGKCAVPLMPASRPSASTGRPPISSRVWLPSSIRAPRRLITACSG